MTADRTEDGVQPTSFNVLFVCTGNTCRSPMAEVVARAAIERRGWKHVEVRSAGVSARSGGPASSAAMSVVRDRGLDLDGHRSRLLDADLVQWADVILTMSPAHLMWVEDLGGGHKAALLGDFAAGEEAGYAIADPFGGDEEAYRTTLHQLEHLVDRALDRLAMIVNP